MKCLSEDIVSLEEIYPFLLYIKILVKEAPLYTSIDGYLTKLDTLFYSVEDYYGRGKAREIVKAILECDELREALRPLANYISEVEKLVLNDPRHLPTRRYLDLLIKTLKRIEPLEKPLEITRPRTLEPSRAEPHYIQMHVAELPRFELEEQMRNRYDWTHKAEPKKREGNKLRVVALGILAIVIMAFITLGYPGLLDSWINPSNQSTASRSTYTPPHEPTVPSSTVTSIQTLWEIRREVYGNYTPKSAVETILRLIDWALVNLEYGDGVGRKINLTKQSYMFSNTLKVQKYYPVLAPEEVLRNRRGMCIDLSVFYAVALLSVNVSPVYIIVFDDFDHAVLGVEINNTLYVIEATNPMNPPSELSDYVNYVLGSKMKLEYTYLYDTISVFKLYVSDSHVVYIEYPSLTVLYDVKLDEYRDDTLPASLGASIAQAIAQMKGLVVSETVKYNWKTSFTLYPGYLQSMSNETHPLTRLYTPVFNEWWIKYYVTIVSNIVDPNTYRYIWVDVQGDNVNVYLA